MAPRPPNYSHERSQRERAQAAKADAKAERRAEKSARKKAAREGTAPSGEIPPKPEG
ncbi:MAG TPA: hypothetical protein VJ476_06440 [Rhizomicrobium sp.]|jgi:hypothetical protein|nr:hypothetical protein [Rhizomicrobium sp.]